MYYHQNLVFLICLLELLFYISIFNLEVLFIYKQTDIFANGTGVVWSLFFWKINSLESFTIQWSVVMSELLIWNSRILRNKRGKKWKKIGHSCCEEVTIENVQILFSLFSFDSSGVWGGVVKSYCLTQFFHPWATGMDTAQN